MDESYINIPVPTKLFLELVDFLREVGSDRDPVEEVSTAIAYWIENASDKQEDLLPETVVNWHGYTWKEVFLPEHTAVRMKYKGTIYYAAVVQDDLIYEGAVVSPSEFANKITKSSRNAWRDLEIKRPGDGVWVAANMLRLKAIQFKKVIDEKIPIDKLFEKFEKKVEGE